MLKSIVSFLAPLSRQIWHQRKTWCPHSCLAAPVSTFWISWLDRRLRTVACAPECAMARLLRRADNTFLGNALCEFSVSFRPPAHTWLGWVSNLRLLSRPCFAARRCRDHLCGMIALCAYLVCLVWLGPADGDVTQVQPRSPQQTTL